MRSLLLSLSISHAYDAVAPGAGQTAMDNQHPGAEPLGRTSSTAALSEWWLGQEAASGDPSLLARRGSILDCCALGAISRSVAPETDIGSAMAVDGSIRWDRMIGNEERRPPARMDIEPPHHPIESKRDFFIHLFTITCGLLIALSLESLVEWVHHNAIVHEARSNIRRELTDNQKAAMEDIRSVNEDRLRFEHNLVEERGLRDDPKAHHSVESTFNWSSMSDAAWRTARDTGALAYMPYTEVQRYADVYGQQEIANTQAIQLFRQQVEAIAPLMIDKAPHPSAPEFDRLLHDTATVMIDLQTLGQILTQLHDQYSTVLNAH